MYKQNSHFQANRNAAFPSQQKCTATLTVVLHNWLQLNAEELRGFTEEDFFFFVFVCVCVIAHEVLSFMINILNCYELCGPKHKGTILEKKNIGMKCMDKDIETLCVFIFAGLLKWIVYPISFLSDSLLLIFRGSKIASNQFFTIPDKAPLEISVIT